ncbi:MAG: type II toxin-antitoxin system RatA family toxin [Hyphomicrobium sp.]|nr:type II toxin-antitoxin system RatA family toxin [Hyphomicrobium sp.]
MPRFNNVRTVPFSSDEMFALVADVEKYPLFVPLCESLVVHTREQLPDGTGLITATMGIGYKAIREKFTTAVTLDRPGRAIVVRHKNGPFRKLENVWGFTPRTESTCDVAFALDYEFSSPVLAVLMGAVFDTAFRKFAAAFETRAGEVYGRRAPVSSTVT